MSRPPQALGQVTTPLVTFGLVAFALGTVTEVIGVFRGPTEALRQLWDKANLEMSQEMGVPDPPALLLVALVSFALVAAILHTPGAGRRLVLGFSALILSLSLVPAFAVWGIFWQPFGLVLAVIWSWFSASVYTATHRMPCEGGAEEVVPKVISLVAEEDAPEGEAQSSHG